MLLPSVRTVASATRYKAREIKVVRSRSPPPLGGPAASLFKRSVALRPRLSPGLPFTRSFAIITHPEAKCNLQIHVNDDGSCGHTQKSMARPHPSAHCRGFLRALSLCEEQAVRSTAHHYRGPYYGTLTLLGVFGHQAGEPITDFGVPGFGGHHHPGWGRPVRRAHGAA
jgi:hypothetical protein